ncbi:hypothetical protein [Flavobacterium sp. JP2137]|uniref:hypothetical protein n=1 Tax=Flavobacterium sp. JP2137 TaxID=3414510 RepID=UPI003D2FC681
MKNYVILMLLYLMTTACCSSSDSNPTPVPTPTPTVYEPKVMLLKVNYLTNAFEGAVEIPLEKKSSTFTLRKEYQEPSDIGNIKLFHKETDQLLFDASIIWMGKGRISYPQFIAPDNFERVAQPNPIYPVNGFKMLILFDSFFVEPDLTQAWARVQTVMLAREYLNANPEQQVNVYLHQPSADVGDPEDWRWIFFLKN